MTKNADPQKKKERIMHDPAEFAANMAQIVEKCRRIMQEFVKRRSHGASAAPIDPLNLSSAFSELFARMLADPAGLMEKQLALWQGYYQLWQNTAQRMMGAVHPPLVEPDARDRRFKDEAWQENLVFDFIKQSYLLSARWLQQTVGSVSGLDPRDAQKVDFYTRQFVDALSPSNFLLTNPEVLKATIETNGENLVEGLQNLLEDLEQGQISMTDMRAFEIGKNVATTRGKAVYQNGLMQLIQYEPQTKQVHRTPLLVIPAWINKYYILDLQPENSLIGWLVKQGYTVFAVSWVNPDERHSGKTFDDYMLEGPLAAMRAIEQATGEKQVSVMAYCLGGTLMSATLAYLEAKGKADSVKSATYLTTMVDFSEAGELSVFIDEEQLSLLEKRMSASGYLEGSEMAMTFNMLRANDLIWSFVVNNYLLGKDPFPFDLLYWNADSTRMPALMHSFYLRNMYQKNLLAKPGGITLDGTPIDLRKVRTPSYILSSREDHIAPWKSTYAATQLYKGPVAFVLAASGHIAGVINPPERKKYSHWINPKQPPDPDDWFAGAKESPGSWWPHWHAWQEPYRGEQVPARTPGDGKLKVIEDAPGSYVKVKS